MGDDDDDKQKQLAGWHENESKIATATLFSFSSSIDYLFYKNAQFHFDIIFPLLLSHTQRLKPGDDNVDGPHAIEDFSIDNNRTVIQYGDNDDGIKVDGHIERILAPRADGLVREMKTKKVISREEIQERTETEDVKHYGDFTDEVSPKSISFLSLNQKDFVKCIQSGWSFRSI